MIEELHLLILDEATSSLDTRTKQAIQSNLAALATDVTTVAIAHRLSTIRGSDEIVVLQDG